MKLVYIALGSNLGVPESQVESAIQALSNLPNSSKPLLSRWYKSKAIGGPDNQPDYLNAVCSIQTTIPPLDLLDQLQKIEQDAGRNRDIRWGPRTLDLDIIWYEGSENNTDHLTLPHPRAHLRAFVIKPLLDLSADFQLQGQSLSFWNSECSQQELTAI